MGGDLRGVENALQAGYFNDLGVTALWLTPVVKNVWRSGYDLGGWKTGYHGYWAQDWLDIDPHLTSRTSLAGKPYPDRRRGPHAALPGLRETRPLQGHQDHPGRRAQPRGPGVLTTMPMATASSTWPRRTSGCSPSSAMASTTTRNGRTSRSGTRGAPSPTARASCSARKSPPRARSPSSVATAARASRTTASARTDGEEVTCDFFSLRDFWTAPDGAHFDALVDEFVEIYHFYLTTVGVDGLRIDTVKHVHHAVLGRLHRAPARNASARPRRRSCCSARSTTAIPRCSANTPGAPTGRKTTSRRSTPCSISISASAPANTSAIRATTSARPPHLEKSLATRTADGSANGRPFYNPNPGPDGLNSQQKIITFIENHDGLNRFRVAGVTERAQPPRAGTAHDPARHSVSLLRHRVRAAGRRRENRRGRRDRPHDVLSRNAAARP